MGLEFQRKHTKRGEIMEKTQSAIRYLKDNLGVNGDFMKEWKRLSEDDKAELRAQAQKELDQQ